MTKFIKGCVLLSVFLIACSKNNSSANTSAAPTNLTVNAVATTDSSGNVSFTAKANNAVSYDFDFGNGSIQTVPSGTVTYKYPQSGTYTVNVIARSSSGQTISANTQVTIAVKMSLYWSDEFNTDGAPDASKWSYNTGAGGWGNNELEYYTNRPDNVIVQGGMLKITAKAESYMGSNYTSARILTQGKFDFTYGHVDIRAMLPAGVGTWPALWMLGSNINSVPWPGCGEIDIMEQKGSQPGTIYGTLHYPGHSGANGNSANTTVANTTTQFHIYSVDWTPAYVKLSVDSVVYQTVANNSSLPFNLNFFFIMNVAMGGDFTGPVDPNFTSATMQVDYIRVYK